MLVLHQRKQASSHDDTPAGSHERAQSGCIGHREAPRQAPPFGVIYQPPTNLIDVLLHGIVTDQRHRRDETPHQATAKFDLTILVHFAAGALHRLWRLEQLVQVEVQLRGYRDWRRAEDNGDQSNQQGTYRIIVHQFAPPSSAVLGPPKSHCCCPVVNCYLTIVHHNPAAADTARCAPANQRGAQSRSRRPGWPCGRVLPLPAGPHDHQRSTVHG